ncbi:MAG: hypothetical protein HDQ88_02270 [Clostridia bacterium]|nr:hypothetical protein [Clostridia bacterium]
MMKNLVSQCGGVPVVIRNDLGFTTLDDQAMTRTESYVIDIKRFSGDGCEAEVYTDTTFVLDGKTTSTLCRCRLWEGAEKVFDTKAGKAAAGGKTVRWYLYDDATDDWKERTAGVDANGELTITTEDVKTYLQVMAAVFSSADEHDYRKADAHDIQEIFDKTDALMINPNPTPANLTLRRGETDPDGVTLAPTTYDRDTEKALTGVKYKFVCYSPSGTILNGTTSQGMGYDSPTHGQQGVADNTELLTSYKVPRTMFEALGEGPRVDIRAFK